MGILLQSIEAGEVITKVFKGKSVRRDVFVFVRQVSLEALRRKLFELTLYN